LFYDLFKNTKLSIVVNEQFEQKKVLLSRPYNAEKFSLKGVILCFISKAFFYSHYYRVCQDLDQYSRLKFNEEDYVVIQDKLESILNALGKRYSKLYRFCSSQHNNKRIAQESLLLSEAINTDFADTLACEVGSNFSPNFYYKKNIKSLNNTKPNKNFIEQSCWLDSQLLLNRASILNDLLLYQDSIKILTQSIKSNPSNKEAYIERALAYFETNQIELALKDYKEAKKLQVVFPFLPGIQKAASSSRQIPKNKIEFSEGLILGTVEGAKVSTIEFLPSLLSCCRGTLNGLWAFACSPKEVSNDMINAAYEIGEFISNNSAEECLQCVVPEFKELSLMWNSFNDNTKGQKIGFIIGKYGVEIFAPIGILKGVNKVKALKRANTMLTLESCASSKVKEFKILEESAKRISLRETIILESAEKGKILVKNSNVQYHVMRIRLI
jgi:tetratricopeptide (TPR) repeat protein